jgi:hypothetical protein
MNRRPRLPGADELFRATGGGPASQAAALAELPASDSRLARTSRPDGSDPAAHEPADDDVWGEVDAAPVRPVRMVRTSRRPADGHPTGRERHEEKITVYCSPEELMQIEQARLTLRGGHGLAVDRGRIVREAVAVVLADLDAKGEASILVRRLRGR